MKRKKKKKLSIKKALRLIIPLFIITLLFIYRNDIYVSIESYITKYSKETIEVLLKNDDYKEIKNNKYSKVLDEIVKTEYYNPKYNQEYLNINYQERDNFYKNITSLLDIGYNSKEINVIYKYINYDTNILILINNRYIEDIDKIIGLDYFHEYNLESYIKYLNLGIDHEEETIVDKVLTYEDGVTEVNIGLNNEYYTNVKEVENPNDYLVIVNKYNSLSKDYEPSDLEVLDKQYRLSWRDVSLRKEAKKYFQEMCEAARRENIYIYGGSGYRSYSYQLNLYNNYVRQDGFAKAETYSARAGYSEHQTGLAMDILNGRQDYISESDKEYTWIINNSYKFGYILRYPKGMENITGYMYEEWHFRYVGIEAAEYIKTNMTFDEYIAKDIYLDK